MRVVIVAGNWRALLSGGAVTIVATVGDNIVDAGVAGGVGTTATCSVACMPIVVAAVVVVVVVLVVNVVVVVVMLLLLIGIVLLTLSTN